jgi:hypothetical protein
MIRALQGRSWVGLTAGHKGKRELIEAGCLNSSVTDWKEIASGCRADLCLSG